MGLHHRRQEVVRTGTVQSRVVDKRHIAEHNVAGRTPNGCQAAGGDQRGPDTGIQRLGRPEVESGARVVYAGTNVQQEVVTQAGNSGDRRGEVASQKVRTETIRGGEHRGSGQKVKEKWGEVSTLGTQLFGGGRQPRGLGCDSGATIKHNLGPVYPSLGPSSDTDFRTGY